MLSNAELEILNKVQKERERILNFNAGIEYAASLMECHGHECGGGSGEAIIQAGTHKGERFGEVWYRAADSIRKLKLPLTVTITLPE